MSTVEGHHGRPSATVLTLREEFPGFLVREPRGDRGRPRPMAISTRTTDGGRPEPVVCAGAEELRKAPKAMEGGAA
ncbi:hypothetical protein [Nocardiopsis lambiniae]|uniref:DUF397 domain-containing protein n=1 Tax=Nocardiopsis lambiniae TaxID=3075539 RepID=A0ABU2M5M5_9ACTN|nr:hypothetical protein [Nocardiopsis sp. DSM 44743]MDT0327626.1 hypothetical protein [Nocardiopsis sp. DSM 44743]